MGKNSGNAGKWEWNVMKFYEVGRVIIYPPRANKVPIPCNKITNPNTNTWDRGVNFR